HDYQSGEGEAGPDKSQHTEQDASDATQHDPTPVAAQVLQHRSFHGSSLDASEKNRREECFARAVRLGTDAAYYLTASVAANRQPAHADEGVPALLEPDYRRRCPSAAGEGRLRPVRA